MKFQFAAAVAAVALTSGVNAAVVFNTGKIFASSSTSYGVDTAATLTSNSITAGDGLATFQISFDVTPTAGTQIVSNSGNFWAVNDGVDTDVDFTGTEAVASIGNIQVTNFNANGGTLSTLDITNLTFDFVFITGGNGGQDAGFVTANGDTGNWVDMNNAGADFVGHVPGGNGVGGFQLIGDNTNSLTGDASVTSFSLGATGTSTAWRIDSITVSGMSVPEPSIALLGGLGVLGLLRRRR